MPFQVTKKYGHELGLSCAFRQWRAKSHCAQLHGYALAFEFVFEVDNVLDERNWVIDFGGLKDLKDDLRESFDHKTAVAGDDPLIHYFKHMHDAGVMDMLVFTNGVGCERFAEHAWWKAWGVVQEYNREHNTNVRVVSCKCSEHGANSATYIGKE